MFIGTEITPEEAVKLWNTKSLFAYDTEQEVDWQINIDNPCDLRGAYQILDEVNQNKDIVLYIENG